MPTISTLTVAVETRTSKFSTGLKVLAGGLTALAGGAAFAFGKFEEAQKVTNQTAAVLKSTGGAANVTAKQIEDLSGALSEKAGVDDELIQSGANVLLTFRNIANEAGKGNDIFNQATQSTLDLSVALGKDMTSASLMVGKALNDPIAGIGALSRAGVQFTTQQKEQITRMVEAGNVMGAQKMILAELTAEFAGSAEAQRTASGSTAVALENLAETLGQLVAPAFEFLAEKAQIAVDFLMKNAGPVFESVMDWFKGIWERVQPVAEIIGGELLEAASQIWGSLKQQLIPALVRLWDSLKPILPILGLIAAAILKVAIEVIPIIIDVWARWIGTLSKGVEIISDVVGAVVRFFQRLWQDIKDVVGNIVEAWSAAWGKVKEVFTGIWSGIVAVAKAAINIIIGALNLLIGGINRALDALDVLSGPTVNFGEVPTIPKLHTGGTVLASGIAEVQRGEVVLPAGGGGSGDIVLQVDGQTFARISRDQLLKLKGSRVSLGLA